jgi:hypothetical protein
MKKPTAKNSHLLVRQRHKDRIKARRPDHKKFLLHPATVFLLLCTGVLLFGWTWKASAADYAVRAKVPAVPLTESAEITNPKTGNHFKTKPIGISGTCPYQSYVELFRNGAFSGVTICNQDSTFFSLDTDLTAGINVLQAHVFNITDDEGPLGQPVTIYYDPPQPPQQILPAQKPDNQPFRLSSDYKHRGFAVNEEISWQLVISGGSGPYAFNVKWGDGNESNYVQKDNSPLEINHNYNKAGIYDVKIQGVDVIGSQAFLQLSALVTQDRNALITGTSSGGPKLPLNLSQQSALVWLWPSYAIVVAMVFSFWLGEMQQLHILAHRGGRIRLKRH